MTPSACIRLSSIALELLCPDCLQHFCQGRRRLELFGEDHNIRPGWLTLGSSLSESKFDKDTYKESFRINGELQFLLPFSQEIADLHPNEPAKGAE